MKLKLQHISVLYIKPYLKNNYRLNATLLGTNLLPDDGFI